MGPAAAYEAAATKSKAVRERIMVFVCRVSSGKRKKESSVENLAHSMKWIGARRERGLLEVGFRLPGSRKVKELNHERD